MDRKKKLRFAQFFLLVLASLVIFFTYYRENTNLNNKIVNKENIKNVKKQLSNENPTNKNLFFNVEYSGLDLTGNRYVLKSEEAYSEIEDQSKVFMTNVNANFYFKDNTTLIVKSEKGEYNNESLDMIFFGKVEANYQGSSMMASKAEYSNTKGMLMISENVKIKDIRGTMLADNLIFDIKEKKLEITSFENNNINANINLK